MNLLINKIMLLVPSPGPLVRDLELPLPLDSYYLKILLVLLFLVHILFVNLMVGGSILTLFFEIVGLTHRKYDGLAKKIAETITVNKSLAVVLGVGPLLCINLAYTTHFYSANALTGYAWISIVPLVTLAFLLAYLHKYTWDRWQGAAKRWHLATGFASVFLFLCVPLIFLANINLMLFPEKWSEVGGFFASLQIGNVFPRYFHFLAASLAVTGLFLAGYFGRKKFAVEKALPEFTRPELRRLFYRVAFWVSMAQLAFGPLLLFTLPSRGLTVELFLIIGAGILFVAAVLLILRSEIRADGARIGRRYFWIWGLLTVVVLAMGTGRHLYREASLAEHKALIADENDRFNAIMLAAHMRLDAGEGLGEALGGGLTGEKVFINCAACHAVNKVLAAPSLVEIYGLYKDNPSGIITWAKNPGKKRPEFAPMPSFAHLGDESLGLVAEYMLEQGGKAASGSAGN